jgi:hypothetical protein
MAIFICKRLYGVGNICFVIKQTAKTKAKMFIFANNKCQLCDKYHIIHIKGVIYENQKKCSPAINRMERPTKPKTFDTSRCPTSG